MSTSVLDQPGAETARPLIAVGFTLIGFAAWNQYYWWLSLDDDKFGWLTPIFALYVLWDRRDRLSLAWRNCQASNSPEDPALRRILWNAAAGLMFVLGLLLVLAAAADHAGGGHSFKGTFLGSVGIACLMLSLPWFCAPGPRGVPTRAPQISSRLELCKLLLFPALIWLCSEPFITETETRASFYALAPMAWVIAHGFSILGIPLIREGNILLMPDLGHVGIEEACSGIRSFSACLFAGTFLGALMLRRFSSKVLLVLLTTTVAFLLNFARSVFLTGWAYCNGTRSIEGFVHDTAGYTVMALTVLSLLLILNQISRFAQKSHSFAASPKATATIQN